MGDVCTAAFQERLTTCRRGLDGTDGIPVFLAVEEAAVNLRRLLQENTMGDRLEVKQMVRLTLPEGVQDENDPLAALLSMAFTETSGLEFSSCVIIDRLVCEHLESICPRRVFSMANRAQLMETAEQEKLRVALCQLFLVITRCRGPILWLEDRRGMVDHPLIGWLQANAADLFQLKRREEASTHVLEMVLQERAMRLFPFFTSIYVA